MNWPTSCCTPLAARIQVDEPRRDARRGNRRASRNLRLRRSALGRDGPCQGRAGRGAAETFGDGRVTVGTVASIQTGQPAVDAGPLQAAGGRAAAYAFPVRQALCARPRWTQKTTLTLTRHRYAILLQEAELKPAFWFSVGSHVPHEGMSRLQPCRGWSAWAQARAYSLNA